MFRWWLKMIRTGLIVRSNISLIVAFHSIIPIVGALSKYIIVTKIYTYILSCHIQPLLKGLIVDVDLIRFRTICVKFLINCGLTRKEFRLHKHKNSSNGITCTRVLNCLSNFVKVCILELVALECLKREWNVIY